MANFDFEPSNPPSHLACYPQYDIVKDKCPTDWLVKDHVGKGAFGEVWKACCGKDCKFVLKHVTGGTVDEFYNEVNMQIEGAKLGLCPAIYAAGTCKQSGVGIIVMRSMKQTVLDLFRRYRELETRLMIVFSVIGLITKLHSKGYIHGDSHLNNIMVTFKKLEFSDDEDETEMDVYQAHNYTYMFIDMGLAKKLVDVEDKTRAIQDDFIKFYQTMTKILDGTVAAPNPDQFDIIIKYLGELLIRLK